MISSGKVRAMNFISVIALAGVTAIAGGCGDGSKSDPPQTGAGPGSTETPATASTAAPRGKAQPRLETLKLWVGTNQVNAEIAKTQTQVMAGLMWRTNMAEMDGMLFVFAVPHQTAFWMKNTLLPLSCAYMGPDGAILELHDMEPLNTNSIPASTDQIQYVLEMNRGWFQRHNVSTGVVMQTESGTLSQTFFGR